MSNATLARSSSPTSPRQVDNNPDGTFVDGKVKDTVMAIPPKICVPTANEIYFGPPCDPHWADARERLFFGTLRQENGTYKYTYGRRMDDLNDLILRWLPCVPRLGVMDVAASSGASGLTWSESLFRAGVKHTMTLGDLRVHGYLVSIGKRLRVLVDSTGYPLQFDVGGHAFANPPARRRWWWLLPLFASMSRIASRAVRSSTTADQRRGMWFGGVVRIQPVTLMSPRVLESPLVTIVEDDLLSKHSRLGPFHVVRAANLLNRDYFDEVTLRKMIERLRQRLLPGGLLALCTTENDIQLSGAALDAAHSGTNHATLFVLNEGELQPVARLGNGSPVESLVVSMNSNATAAPLTV